MQILDKICLILTKIFKKFKIQDLFCHSIHAMHLCDNFGAFNINIKDLMGKNSEKSPKITPLCPT